jgi:hypothetical protein
VVGVAALAGGLLWGFGGFGGGHRLSVESTVPYQVHNGVHVYNFEQAVAAGVEPSLQGQLKESRLPLCPPPSKGTGGYRSAKALERAIKKAPEAATCMADPRGTVTATGTVQSFYAMNAVPEKGSLLRYIDRAGWSIDYPERFHAVGYTVGVDHAIEGATFANFKPIPVPGDSTDDPAAGPQIPPTGVLFQLTASYGGLIGGAPQGGQEAHFPLPLARSVATHSSGDSVQSGDLTFQADGGVYTASFTVGTKASDSDLRSLAAMIASIRFPPLKTGGQAGPYVVLDRASAYPLGSVTFVKHAGDRYLTGFYLVHDRAGFRALAWPGNLYGPPWTGPCLHVLYDHQHQQFYCHSGGRWNLHGSVITNPPGATQVEPLTLLGSSVSQDGHVLVTPDGGSFAVPLRARR